MSDVVERAKAALEGVSRGPWKMGSRSHPDVVMTPNGCLWNPGRGEVNNPADGEFVAAARTLVPELIVKVEKAIPLRIETAADLDRVPSGSVVRSSAGTIACRFDGRNGVVFGDERPFPWHKLALPAEVIWDPRNQR